MMKIEIHGGDTALYLDKGDHKKLAKGETIKLKREDNSTIAIVPREDGQ